MGAMDRGRGGYPQAQQMQSARPSVARVEEGTSLLNSFTVQQIQSHLQSLKTGLRLTSAKIKQKCQPVLKKLQEHNFAWIFNQPVDPVELGLNVRFASRELPFRIILSPILRCAPSVAFSLALSLRPRPRARRTTSTSSRTRWTSAA